MEYLESLIGESISLMQVINKGYQICRWFTDKNDNKKGYAIILKDNKHIATLYYTKVYSNEKRYYEQICTEINYPTFLKGKKIVKFFAKNPTLEQFYKKNDKLKTKIETNLQENFITSVRETIYLKNNYIALFKAERTKKGKIKNIGMWTLVDAQGYYKNIIKR